MMKIFFRNFNNTMNPHITYAAIYFFSPGYPQALQFRAIVCSTTQLTLFKSVKTRWY